MAEHEGSAGTPGLEQVSGWVGFDVDDVDGRHVGRVHSVYADAGGAAAAWLVVALGRRGARKVAIAVRECAGGGGRVWTAQPREALGEAPAVDPARPLLREHELAICAHYGVGESNGRAAEVAGRARGSVTAKPAAR
jgi:hypothetical protein